MVDLGHATGARLLEEEHLGEAQQNAVSAPHIGLQCLQQLRQLTLDACDLEEMSERDVASAAGSALNRDCRLPLQISPTVLASQRQRAYEYLTRPWNGTRAGVASDYLSCTEGVGAAQARHTSGTGFSQQTCPDYWSIIAVCLNPWD